MPLSLAVLARCALTLTLLLAGLAALPPHPLAAAPPPAPTALAGLALPRATATVAVQRGSQTIRARPLATVTTADGREAVAGRLLVGFHPDAVAQADAVHRRAGSRGAGLVRVIAPLGHHAQVVAIADTAPLEAALAAYRADPRVRYAEPDYVLRAFGLPSDPALAQQWGLTQIAAPVAWTLGHGSPNRLIAILDCGIYEQGVSLPNGWPGHPDLAGKVVAAQDFTGSLTGADDYCNHGSHVAGIAAAVTNNALGVAGVGYDTRLLNGKVLDDLGTGTISSVVQGISWATDHGAQVINMSLGANGPCVAPLQEVINDAWNRQVVVVAAAGNDNLSTPHLPASCDHVLAVASTDATDTKSAFSSHGGWVDVAAPGGRDAAGRGILSTDYIGGYATKSGTSMATPHVAGLAALLWGTGGVTTAQAVVDRITNTADPIAGTGVYWRYGRVNAATALAQALTMPGAVSPQGALTWYFAEGYTGAGFDQYLTLLNPHESPAVVTIAYILPDGAPPVATVTVPARGRATIAVHELAQGVGRDQAVAARVTTTHPDGIVAERSMYFAYQGSAGAITGGHVVLGATTPANDWYFAEGYTGVGFDEYLALLNPGSRAAPVTITYALGDGTTQTRQMLVDAGRRMTGAVHDLADGVGRGQAVAARVTTPSPEGIVVERPMYFAYTGSPGVVTGGHTVLGARQPRQRWLFAEGYTGPGFDEYLTIFNPAAVAVPVAITYTLGDGTLRTRLLSVAVGRRATVAVHDPTTGVGRGQVVAAQVMTPSAEGLVVERPMYFQYHGGITGGHVVLGAT